MERLTLTRTQASDPAYLEKILQGLAPWWCDQCSDVIWFHPDEIPTHVHTTIGKVDCSWNISNDLAGFLSAPYLP